MIGGFGIRLNGVCEGFQVLRHISSPNWVVHLKEVLELRLNRNCNEITLTPNSLNLLNINGTIISSRTKMYKNVYRINKKLYHELYIVFII